MPHLFLALTAILLITPIAVLVIVSRRRDAGEDARDDLTDACWSGWEIAPRLSEIDGEGLGSLHGSEISDV